MGGRHGPQWPRSRLHAARVSAGRCPGEMAVAKPQPFCAFEYGGTSMSDAQKETVILVHGTWAAPIADSVKWYQPGGDAATAKQAFVAKLDAALEKRGSAARC